MRILRVMKKRTQNGFTLYELLITIVIVGIVLAVGIPNLSDFTQSSRISSTTNDLHGSFLLARSEAARAKANITICASAHPVGAALCDGASFDEGWIVFIDLNGDIQRAGSEEHVLKAFPPVDDAIDITTNDGATYFSFAASGLGDTEVNGAAVETAMICDERGNVTAPGGNSAARRLIITPIGRSTILRQQETIEASGGSC